jgi:hypothetical protein
MNAKEAAAAAAMKVSDSSGFRSCMASVMIYVNAMQ